MPYLFVYEYTVAILRRIPAGSCRPSADLFDFRTSRFLFTGTERAPPLSGSKGESVVMALRGDEEDIARSSARRCLP
jgi:hypothetical protein